MQRKIIFDTETTGLKPEEGHRIVEFGAVEIVLDSDGKWVKTGKTIQLYMNPDRVMDDMVMKIHGITNEFLQDKPRFSDIVDELITFIKGATLVAHNADFDIKFLNSELDKANKGKLWDYVNNVECTLKLDRRLYAEERKHTLDAMCARFGISTEGREYHGALLDSELLADCVTKIWENFDVSEIEADLEQTNWVRPEVKRYNLPMASIVLSDTEEAAHLEFLTALEKKDKVVPVFSKSLNARPQL